MARAKQPKVLDQTIIRVSEEEQEILYNYAMATRPIVIEGLQSIASIIFKSISKIDDDAMDVSLQLVPECYSFQLLCEDYEITLNDGTISCMNNSEIEKQKNHRYDSQERRKRVNARMKNSRIFKSKKKRKAHTELSKTTAHDEHCSTENETSSTSSSDDDTSNILQPSITHFSVAASIDNDGLNPLQKQNNPSNDATLLQHTIPNDDEMNSSVQNTNNSCNVTTITERNTCIDDAVIAVHAALFENIGHHMFVRSDVIPTPASFNTILTEISNQETLIERVLGSLETVNQNIMNLRRATHNTAASYVTTFVNWEALSERLLPISAGVIEAKEREKLVLQRRKLADEKIAETFRERYQLMINEDVCSEDVNDFVLTRLRRFRDVRLRGERLTRFINLMQDMPWVLRLHDLPITHIYKMPLKYMDEFVARIRDPLQEFYNDNSFDESNLLLDESLEQNQGRIEQLPPSSPIEAENDLEDRECDQSEVGNAPTVSQPICKYFLYIFYILLVNFIDHLHFLKQLQYIKDENVADLNEPTVNNDAVGEDHDCMQDVNEQVNSLASSATSVRWSLITKGVHKKFKPLQIVTPGQDLTENVINTRGRSTKKTLGTRKSNTIRRK